MELGLTLVIVGTGNVLIVSVAGGAEVPPPGWPVKTVTCTMAGVAMSVELTTLVRVLELTYVVVRGTPLNCTTEVGENPDPWAVNVNCGPPAATAPGEIPEICGAGLLIVNVAALDAPPPGAGFATTICAVPPTARSEGVSAICNWVALTNVVVRLIGFHWTEEF